MTREPNTHTTGVPNSVTVHLNANPFPRTRTVNEVTIETNLLQRKSVHETAFHLKYDRNETKPKVSELP